MHFLMRFGINLYNFDTILFGVLFQMLQTAHSRYRNSRDILRSWIFIKSEAFPMGLSGLCANQGPQWMPFFYGMGEMKRSIVVNERACIPITGKTELLLCPKCGYSPTNYVFRVLWWGTTFHREQWHPKSEVINNLWRMIMYSEGCIFHWLLRTQARPSLLNLNLHSSVNTTPSNNRPQTLFAAS